MLKIIATIFFLLLLNGCVQSTAFLGPIFTGASTGSAYQAGLSYGSGAIVKKITKKNSTENFKKFLETVKNNSSENANNFFNVVKKINENNSVKNLVNQ